MIGKDVWFDNVSIQHYNSIVLEEDHYYPFGLTMNINATNVQVQKNPYKYQGIELEKHFGLEQYETYYRGLDPQLGRFTQIDPLADLFTYQSPFVSMDNNPVSYVDPDGSYSRFGAWWRNKLNGGSGTSKTEATGEWGYDKQTNERVEHRDGLTGKERQSRINTFKQTHIRVDDTWVDIKESGGEIKKYKPTAMQKWADSKNIFSKFAYDFTDAFYVTGQNLFTKNFRSDDMAFHIGGTPTTVDDNINAFTDVGSSFVPWAEAKFGLGYMEKLNVAQFLKFSKGTAFARMKPGARGKFIKALNYGIEKWNDKIPTADVVNDGIDLVKPSNEEKK